MWLKGFISDWRVVTWFEWHEIVAECSESIDREKSFNLDMTEMIKHTIFFLIVFASASASKFLGSSISLVVTFDLLFRPGEFLWRFPWARRKWFWHWFWGCSRGVSTIFAALGALYLPCWVIVMPDVIDIGAFQTKHYLPTWPLPFGNFKGLLYWDRLNDFVLWFLYQYHHCPPKGI